MGISGASGITYAVNALKLLRAANIETHLVISKAGERTLAHEMDCSLNELKGLADHSYSNKDIGAAIASGSFRTDGMMIAPCSVKTMSEIHTGVTSSLLTRAADVVLKERRKLVLMVRETPLHTGHLRTMTGLSEMGAIIAPPMPAFYTNPANLDEMVLQTVGRVLDLFDIDSNSVQRWGEDLPTTPR